MIRVSDHAILRYLERARGLDVEAVRDHIAGRMVNGARLHAVGVTIEKVKFVLQQSGDDTIVVTTLRRDRPSRRG